MIKKLFGIILMVTLISTTFAGLPVTAAERVNNGGFETVDETGKPTGWSFIGGTIGESILVDSASAHSGSKGLALKPTDTALYASQALSLAPGVNYTCTAWLKVVTLDGYNAALKLEFYPEGGVTALGSSNNQYSITDANNVWKQVSFTFTVPAGTVSTSFLVRNTSTSGEIYWDDISIFETPVNEHPELLDFGNFETTGKWAPSGTAAIKHDPTDPYAGTYCMQVDTTTAGGSAYAYRSITSGLEIGKAYRLSFWFKTNADIRIKPLIKLLHRYAETGKTDVDLTAQYANSIAYSGAASGTDYSFIFPETTKNTWTKYTLCFSIPENGIKTWKQTNVYFGQYASYVGTSDKATVYYDNASLTEDYTEVKFYDATTSEELSTIPAAGATVKAKVHLEGAGTASSIKTLSVISALYKGDGNLRKVQSLATDSKTTGTVFTAGSLNVVNPPSDLELTYTVPDDGGYSIGIYFWDSLSNMLPLESKTGINQ